MRLGPYNVGQKVWPGLAHTLGKVHDVGQILARIVGQNGALSTDLKERLEDSLGHLKASIDFLVISNGLSAKRISAQRDRSLINYTRAHNDQTNGMRPEDD